MIDSRVYQDEITSEEENVYIIYMSSRIKIKIFENDTLVTFISRIRQTIPKISCDYMIGLFEIN